MLASNAALAQGPAANDPPPGEQEIARLIGQLDADTFEVRERASLALARIGRPALAALQAATTHHSAEVRGRAKALVESLTAGVRRREFQEFAATPDESLDLEHGMWLIARILDPEVDKRSMTRQLDELAARVRERLGKGVEPATADPQKLVAALRQVLFVEEGFTGNTQDYGNPDNSSLDRVLATRKGLPVLLSHVTIAVARRLKAPVVGVPLAGVYLAKYDGSRAAAGFPREDIYFHPFEQGKVLGPEELARDFAGRDLALATSGTSRETLTRMLANLTTALGRLEEPDKLEQVRELKGLLEAYGPPGEP